MQVEQKVNKMQRQYFLQEQLKIIKRELGLEVSRPQVVLSQCGPVRNYDSPFSSPAFFHARKMTKMPLRRNSESV